METDSKARQPDSLESSSSTRSLETFSLAQKWIADCITNHTNCGVKNTAEPWYPSRLLDCGPSGDLHQAPGYRLIETTVTAPQGPYMTLSHCWGGVDCLKLTTTNYSNMLEMIPHSSLPRLYQDAVDVVRRLGVRFLWIDSICIIQEGDFSEDWRHEVSRMCDVYSNSYCNISPTAAPNAHHTMFNSRHSGLVSPAIVDGPKQSFIISESRFWEQEVSQAVLNTRAWVLQERLLSPRILHFGRHQLLWECNHKSAAELYPDGIPSSLNLSRNMNFKDWLPKPSTGSTQSTEGYQKWEDIVSAYTTCKLTFPSDKLPAISSIAKILRPILQDQYVAGLWRRFLECQLLWSVTRGNVPPQSTTGGTRGQHGASSYRCPSWSWASVDGQINQGPVDVEPSEMFIRVSDLYLEYATDDDTGLVKGGWLQLRGVLKLLSLKPAHSPNAHSGPGIWVMTVNGVQVSEEQGYRPYRSYQPHVMLDAFHDGFDQENSNEALYCMVGRIQEAGGIIFVLLLELVDRERGVYRRIGLARGWGEAIKQKLLARSGEEATFPCEKYGDDGLHHIRIV